MKHIKHAAALAVCLATMAGMFASCAQKEAAPSVYFLNFKPEQNDAYKVIAEEYQKAKGIAVKVETAASGTYEQQLKSEIAKSGAPTIFQVNGPVGYAAWKDYCRDLKDTDLYAELIDKAAAIHDGDGVYGIPFAIEGYGIIYNRAIMDEYFKMSGAKVKSTEEIKSFDTLKAVAEDMTAKKDALGIEGVFASTSLAPGEEWRWHTHLANVPLYYEFRDSGADLADSAATGEITFRYADGFQRLFDLYLDHSISPKTMLGSKTVVDSMAEFALGKCAMVQNGNWAYSQIADVSGNTVKAEDVGFLPLFIGMDGEQTQGLWIGTENYFCINKNAPQADQDASIDFLTWLYTSDEGKKRVTGDLGFIAPFGTFGENDKPDDPLAREVLKWSAQEGIENIPWNFTIFPSQEFKNEFGAALLQYAQGTREWSDVVTAVTESWKREKANAL